jgi:hypothetical protein
MGMGQAMQRALIAIVAPLDRERALFLALQEWRRHGRLDELPPHTSHLRHDALPLRAG